MDEQMITIFVNGQERTLHTRNADTLLYVLREKLGLTGAKPGCLNGDCGACTVMIDGESQKSCLMLAAEINNKEITTIEELQHTSIQSAFIEKFAFQCGYCTPGFIMNAYTFIQKHPDAKNENMKERLWSNICRCTGYKEIEEAIRALLDVT